MMKRIGPDDGTPRCICELTWKYSVRSTGEMHVPLHGTRAKAPWMLPLNLLELDIGRRKSCLTLGYGVVISASAVVDDAFE